MVEIFKTNITSKTIANRVVKLLQLQFPNSRINFDLEDCDNILRVETKTIKIQLVEQEVAKQGYFCKVLK
ncbi:MAG TPA: hypothetical protein VKZ97_01495 [Flavobacteriaceae bacterium]|nr:hypothetical protein [Flavobacteriaceae bacterium]